MVGLYTQSLGDGNNQWVLIWIPDMGWMTMNIHKPYTIFWSYHVSLDLKTVLLRLCIHKHIDNHFIVGLSCILKFSHLVCSHTHTHTHTNHPNHASLFLFKFTAVGSYHHPFWITTPHQKTCFVQNHRCDNPHPMLVIFLCLPMLARYGDGTMEDLDIEKYRVTFKTC